MFKFTPLKNIKAKVAIIETGIETDIMTGALKFPRNKIITKNARKPPNTIV
jgi:hypothetical protein